MSKTIALILLLFLSFFSKAFAQNEAQPVTIQGYTGVNPSRDMPLTPNQNSNAPTSNSINSTIPVSGSSTGMPSNVPQPDGDSNLAPSENVPQPLAQPSAPTSIMQPAVPANPPLPPSVPTPERPDNMGPEVIQPSGNPS